MSESEEEALAAFVERVANQLEKNGFPERKVAFPIERMYESAYAKGVNFNKVLAVLAERGIDHEKTPEKIIFGRTESASVSASASASASGLLAGFDPSSLDGLSKEELFASASAAMQQLGPEQLAALRAMVEGMSPDEQASLIDQARKLGLA